MNTRPKDERLPTFAVRDLAGPATPASLISITEKQYDSTLGSQPDAALYYLDEDDGEIVTVGSGLELSQRLEDPVSTDNASTLAIDPTHGQLVHVFDIKHSSGSLAEWRDHEAYSSKYLSPSSPPTPSPSGSLQRLKSPSRDELESAFSMPPRSPVTSRQVSVQPDVYFSSPIKTHVAASPSSSEIKQEIVSTNSAKILQGIDEHLSGLAAVLQIAADTFQKAAERTRDADTSVVEDILKGVKGILSEVGSIGMEVFKEVTEDNSSISSIEALSGSHCSTSSVSSAGVPITTTTLLPSEPEVDSVSEDSLKWENAATHKCPCGHSFYNEAALRCHARLRRTRKCSAVALEDADSRRIKRESVDELFAAALAEYESASNVSSQRSTRVKFNLVNETLPKQQDGPSGDSPFSPVDIDQVTPESNQSQRSMFPPALKWHEVDDRITLFPNSSSKSILDDSNEDPDFTARYPPLRSVRRARSTIESRSYRNDKPYISSQPMKNATGEVSLDDLPTASWKRTPRPRFDENDAYHWAQPSKQFTRESAALPDMPRVGFHGINPYKIDASQVSTKPIDTPRSNHLDSQLTDEINRPTFDLSESVYKPLPGAWPDVKPEAESSGAFFNRMTAQKATIQSNKPLQRANTTALSNPASRLKGLQRATTDVSSNPASRLTGPFDPGFPYQPSSDKNTSSTNPWSNRPRRHLSERVRHRHEEPKEKSRLSNFREELRRDMPESSSRAENYRAGLRHHRSVPHFNPYMSSLPRSINSGPIPKMSMDTLRDQSRAEFGPRLSAIRQKPSMRATVEDVMNQSTPREILQPQFNHSVPNIPGSFSTLPARPTQPLHDNKHDKCVEQLKMCGFGLDDDILKDRLHVYAVAANGDVQEAVEMIEEDRRMSRGYIKS